MAGSSTATRMLSTLLLLFFNCFYQMSAAPTHLPCGDVWVAQFQRNLENLEKLARTLPGNNNMNFTDIFSTAEKTCAFPGRFADGVQSLINMQFNDSIVLHIEVNLEHLKDKLSEATTRSCSNLVNLYCNGTLNSKPIVSLHDFHGKLDTLMKMYKSSSN